MTKRRISDLGTPELHKRHEVRDGEASPGVRRVSVIDQRPIDRYLQRGLVSEHLWRAAEHLLRDFTAANLEPSVCMKWSEYLDAGLPAYWGNEHKADGYKRFWKAMDSAGPASYGVLWWVVCMGESAGEWAVRRSLRKTSGLDFLRAALETVAKHYRIR